ncbi:MAG: FtsQ-type POTRA domain-containing protein [Endomicrobium sp.]|jgi:cell division protein FtsQ|nr:FtsQ-type POTRA domain-containing protein [Endomicrobium sp.]
MSKKKRYVYRHVSAAGNCSHSRRKSKKVSKLFLCLVLIVLLAFFVYFGFKKLLSLAYESDKIVVKNIEVIGTKNVTKAEIKELLPFKIGDNLLRINLSEAEDKIKILKPELKNILISRRWQKVKVKLYERTPEAFVICENELFGIDFDDTPFSLRGFMSTMKVPKLFYKSDSEIKELLNFIKRFKAVCGDFIENICEMKISNTGDIVFVMRDNTVIFWGNESNEHLSNKFKKFQKIYIDAISKYKHLEYIDMTLYGFGRAVVKPIKCD